MKALTCCQDPRSEKYRHHISLHYSKTLPNNVLYVRTAVSGWGPVYRRVKAQFPGIMELLTALAILGIEWEDLSTTYTMEVHGEGFTIWEAEKGP